MKKKIIWILGIIACILTISFFINHNNSKDNLEIVGFHWELKLSKGEKLITADTSLRSLYNQNCLLYNSQIFLNKTLQGGKYTAFISLSGTTPPIIIGQSEKQYHIIRKKDLKVNSSGFSTAFIYKNKDYFIYRSLFTDGSVRNVIMMDVVSKDSLVIDSIADHSDFVAKHLVHL